MSGEHTTSPWAASTSGVLDLIALTEDARSSLATSATFAMSLGAKELFHTNFLAFLLESPDPRLGSLQKDLRSVLGLPLEDGEVAYCAVWREHKKLDLIIVPLLPDHASADGLAASKKRCLVIEAKLKAIPTHHQLREYMAKSLSLGYPSPDSKPSLNFGKVGGVRVHTKLLAPRGTPTVHPDWGAVAWEDVCRQVANFVGALDDDCGGLRSILTDYANSLQQVLVVIAATRHRLQQLRETSFDYSRLYKELTHEKLRNIRLHDLVGKVAFDEWVRLLYGQLKEDFVLRGLEHHYKRIKPYVHFSNGSPGLDLEVDCGELMIGVQIQGMQLRRYASSRKERHSLEEDVLDGPLLGGWLNQKACGQPLTGKGNVALHRNPGRRRTNKREEESLSNLRAFNPRKFLYTAIALDDVTLNQVTQEALESIAIAVMLDLPKKPSTPV